MDVRNQRVKPLKRYTGSNLADMGRGAVHARRWWAVGTPGPGEVAGREATRKVCGVLVAMPQGQSWATDPVDRCAVNVGSVLGRPRRLAIQARWRVGASSAERAGDVAEPS